MFSLPPTLACREEALTSDVQLSIDPQAPCELLWTLIPAEASQGLSHFRNNRGRDFAFVINKTGVTPYLLI